MHKRYVLFLSLSVRLDFGAKGLGSCVFYGHFPPNLHTLIALSCYTSANTVVILGPLSCLYLVSIYPPCSVDFLSN